MEEEDDDGDDSDDDKALYQPLATGAPMVRQSARLKKTPPPPS